MRTLGVMTARQDASFRRSMEVVVRSDRGLEIGQVLCEATDDALSHLDKPAAGSIVRSVSDDDIQGIDRIDSARTKKLDACQRHIDALGLDMKLIEVEQLFGGERTIVYYISEERVDFRELVKLLAKDFGTRVEMRQIGVRDEAKLLADYGDCGKPVCCNTHLSAMPPVSMKMAKLQKATLDPTKISGRCGRLKCCLRYEYDNYVETQKQLPKVGARVLTRDGTMKVLNQQILAEQLLVETEDRRRIVIDASEVISVLKGHQRPAESASANESKSKSRSQSDRSSGDSEAHSEGGSKKRNRNRKPRKTEAVVAKTDQAEKRKTDQDESTTESVALDKEKKPTSRNKRSRNRNRRRKRGPKKEDT
jgi:cell fate regulator YaaT (PSP1 superfamily)